MKRIITLIVVNVELQNALERKKYKVIISLEVNGENWVKLSIHISKANNYWWKGWKGPMDLMAQFTISPKEVV